MARLENVRLSGSGKRGDAKITARGRIVWEPGEFSLNGANLYIHFWGEDLGARGGGTTIVTRSSYGSPEPHPLSANGTA